jgi:hypothetical protein
MAINFKLDRTQFAAMSFSEADKAINDYRKYTPRERLTISNRLIAIAYNFPLNSPPPIDKSYFQARNMQDGKHI